MKMKAIYILLTCFLETTFAASGSGWDYSSGSKGPTNWAAGNPLCGGRSQSPVALSDSTAVPSPQLTPFVFVNHGRTPSAMTIVNNGYTLQVTMSEVPVSMSGANLPTSYDLHSYHFHMGSTDRQGSEHTMDGVYYPMEVHLVHVSSLYNLDVYGGLANTDGLAVLGFFFELSNTNNTALDPLLNDIDSIIQAGTNVSMSQPFSLASFLPTNLTEYYRYSGSLTTPTCNEVVIWTVFKNTIKISSSQLQALRALQNLNNASMVDNFRPLQPLNGRSVYVPGNSARATCPPKYVLTAVLLAAVTRAIFQWL